MSGPLSEALSISLTGLGTLVWLAASAPQAAAQDYAGKVTAGVYAADGVETLDLNIRYTTGRVTSWAGWYGPDAATRQARAGVELDLRRPGLLVIPSLQVASRGFAGGSVYAEAGTRVYAIAGVSRTNLQPYMNLTFDPNESWQAGAGVHLGGGRSVAGYTIWDNRLGTGQRNTHLVLREPLAGRRRITLDLSRKLGRDDDGVFVRGSGVQTEVDYHRWFVKLARETRVNFGAATMWRAGGGFRF